MSEPRRPPLPVTRIVSGGQTGVDRGALDAALALGIPHGGWCPRGRLAEDGVIPAHYQLQELDSPQYHVRTRQNVLDSAGTLILHRDELAGGTALTLRFARELGRPCLVLNLDQPYHPADVRRWLCEQRIDVLNVAGPRESSHPGIAADARAALLEILAPPTLPARSAD